MGSFQFQMLVQPINLLLMIQRGGTGSLQGGQQKNVLVGGVDCWRHGGVVIL
jgi:hypothetical protein